MGVWSLFQPNEQQSFGDRKDKPKGWKIKPETIDYNKFFLCEAWIGRTKLSPIIHPAENQSSSQRTLCPQIAALNSFILFKKHHRPDSNGQRLSMPSVISYSTVFRNWHPVRGENENDSGNNESPAAHINSTGSTAKRMTAGDGSSCPFGAVLVTFNRLQGHTIRIDSPEVRMCVCMYPKGRGVIELTRTPLFVNTTVVYLIFIKVATLRSVNILHCGCWTVLFKLLASRSAACWPALV